MESNITLLNLYSMINNTTMPIIYYSLTYQIIGTISLGIILLVGLIGNMLVTLVLILSPKLHTPTNCYLVSLSLSDILVLLSSTTLMLQEIYQPFNYWTLGNFSCKLSVCLQYFSVDVSALSICAFSVERWVGICYPIRAQYMCTNKRAVKIILGIWIFAFIYNLQWIFMTTVQITKFGLFQTCTFKFVRTAYKAVYMCDLILFYALPLCATSVMYIQISLRLFRTDLRGMTLFNQSNHLNRLIINGKPTLLPDNHDLQLWKAFNRIKARKQVFILIT